jgi:hypothetical protein
VGEKCRLKALRSGFREKDQRRRDGGREGGKREREK